MKIENTSAFPGKSIYYSQAYVIKAFLTDKGVKIEVLISEFKYL